MKIVIGNYIIRSDAYNFILQEKKIVKEGKPALSSNKYFNKLEYALTAIVDFNLLQSEAETVSEILSELKKTKKEILTVLKGV